MQIDTKTNIIETSGLGATGGFSIKTTAAAFQLLSSGLYSNKIRAVVRELASNAVDAHTMVQRKDIPIEVKLPNNLDSQFYVKDFGPGLSHENIMHMYTTYFDSSKQASNDFIGGFGVGSKSPFAYTDAFTVESRHDGKRRLYTAFIGEENTPQIAEIGEFPMEPGQETGLTVSMPVKPSDFSSFEREALDLFKWFDVKPTLVGTASQIETPKMTEVMPGISWRSHSPYRENIVVRMGQVVYSIDKFKDSEVASEDVVQAMQGLSRFHPLLDVPIGSIAVAASREEIAYDKKTKEYLNKRLPEVYHLAMKEVVAKLHSFDLLQYTGRQEAYDYLQSYSLALFHSEEKVDELLKMQRQVPALNLIFREQGVSADQFLPIMRGLDAPTLEQSKMVQAAMPYTKEKIGNWLGTAHTIVPRWDTSAFNRAIKVVEIDMPTNSIYAERARKAWTAQTHSHAVKTIALCRVPGVDDADYIKTRDAMIENWGLKVSDVVKLSSLLGPDDLAKYQRTQGLQSVPASTFFSNRPSLCTSDLKSFYYIEKTPSDSYVAPENWNQGKFQRLVEEMQENAAVAKLFLKDAGGDQATLSRVYSIRSEDIEKAKTFPGARSLNDVLVQALDNDAFRAKWDALPIQRERKPVTVEKLFDAGRYGHNGKTIVDKLKQTQLGQALQWLSTIPQWSYTENEKRPPDTQYTVIGGLLSDVSKTTNPLPGKFMDPDLVAERVQEYYPMIPGALSGYSYSIDESLGQEIVRYAAWKDSSSPIPFLADVTTLPKPSEDPLQEDIPSSPTPTF